MDPVITARHMYLLGSYAVLLGFFLAILYVFAGRASRVKVLKTHLIPATFIGATFGAFSMGVLGGGLAWFVSSSTGDLLGYFMAGIFFPGVVFGWLYLRWAERALST